MKKIPTIPIEIQNPSYGNYNGYTIYVTPELKTRLEKIPSKQNGTVFNGLTMGFGGGKYLLEYVEKQLGKKTVLLLTDEKDSYVDGVLSINFETYRKFLRKRFLPLYRQKGEEGSLEYLKIILPKIFGPVSSLTPPPTIKQADATVVHLPTVTNTKKRRGTLLGKVSEIIRASGTDPKKITIDALKDIQAATNQAFYRQQIGVFTKRLSARRPYSETKGKNSWQSWIYKNTWMFGVQYLPAIEKRKVGFDSIPDYLFPTLEGFVDILEIKLPAVSVIQKDNSHHGSYYWTLPVTKAIGQVVNYISEMDLHSLEIKQKIERECRIKTSVIKPRAVILIGSSVDWTDEENEAFRKLSNSLHGIEIVTYDQLKMRAQKLIELYQITHR